MVRSSWAPWSTVRSCSRWTEPVPARLLSASSLSAQPHSSFVELWLSASTPACGPSTNAAPSSERLTQTSSLSNATDAASLSPRVRGVVRPSAALPRQRRRRQGRERRWRRRAAPVGDAQESAPAPRGSESSLRPAAPRRRARGPALRRWPGAATVPSRERTSLRQGAISSSRAVAAPRRGAAQPAAAESRPRTGAVPPAAGTG